MSFRVLLVIFVSLLYSTSSHAWWNDSWNFRKPIKVIASGFDATALNAQAEVGQTPELPLLVRLHAGNFGAYFMDAHEKGNDIRFISGDDKTALKFHIEKWDPLNNLALIWVKVPIENTATGPAGGEKVWMYYGNPQAPKGDDIGGTWDVNTVISYHFENEAGGVIQDRTAYGISPDPATYNVEPNLASLIGVGAKFNGASIMNVPAALPSAIDPAKGWTFATWIKIPAAETAADATAATAPKAAQNEDPMTLLYVQDGGNLLTVTIQGSTTYASLTLADGQVFETPRTAVVTPGTWKHLALGVGDNRLTLFVDGKALSTVEAPLIPMQAAMTIGANSDGSNGLIAEVDEISVSNVLRTPDWIKANASIQGPGSDVLAYGDDEVYGSSSGEAAYLLTILHSVDTIGWIDIGIIMLLGMAALLVVINKAMFLKKVVGGNRKFLKVFKTLETSVEHSEHDTSFLLALLSDAKKYRSSSLFRVYEAGALELKNRIGSTAGAQACDLRPQSIDAIRAIMDAAMTRELQRLNSQMVTLTIAISGGPFLGLLGTVLGVMITFAAIAATGDVNISAIAPGVSAALMTTVAGLLVAIPALFSYNWLSLKIRDVTINMRVFGDELVSRIAEHHS